MVNLVQPSQNLTPFSAHDVNETLKGNMDGRQVYQLPGSDLGEIKNKAIHSVTSKFQACVEFLSQATGALVAISLSIVTCGMALIIWNATHDNYNDLFTTCIKQGLRFGQSFNQIIFGR